MKIVREGDTVSTYYFDTSTNAWTMNDSQTLIFIDPIYVAIGAWTNTLGEYATAHFTDVELTLGPSSCDDWELYE